MGSAIAAGFLQRALNALNRTARDYPDIAVDRIIGPRTLAALDAFLRVRHAGGETVLLRAMEALQGERYIALAERRPSQEAFLYGWLANRVGAARISHDRGERRQSDGSGKRGERADDRRWG